MAVKVEVKRVLLEDSAIKWIWSESELIRFRDMWNEGVKIHDIAKEFRVNKKTIALLVMDQADEGMIEQRKGGLFGGGE